MWQPTMNKLPGDRLHLHHGPIDIVLKCWGTPENVRAATRAASRAFPRILPLLMEEVKELRKPISKKPKVKGSIASRMVAAAEPFSSVFVTPMAAVAGAVAEGLLEVMLKAAPLDKAYVNDGGDIAIHLTPGHSLNLGVAGDFTGGKVPQLNGSILLTSELGQYGIATSGAQGRSFSLGIVDSVTVVAKSASIADVAATLIGNAVNIDSKKVQREKATELDPDSDLGDLLVTMDVAKLTPQERVAALDNGVKQAEVYLAQGLIAGAVMMLQSECRVVGAPMALVKGMAA
jgi:ApbE superfamily uncharacterized protein (UPF0280 family)